MTQEEKREAWEFAEGLIGIDNLKSSDDLNVLVEREIRGEITKEDIKVYLRKKYTAIGKKQNI